MGENILGTIILVLVIAVIYQWVRIFTERNHKRILSNEVTFKEEKIKKYQEENETYSIRHQSDLELIEFKEDIIKERESTIKDITEELMVTKNVLDSLNKRSTTKPVIEKSLPAEDRTNTKVEKGVVVTTDKDNLKSVKVEKGNLATLKARQLEAFSVIATLNNHSSIISSLINTRGYELLLGNKREFSDSYGRGNTIPALVKTFRNEIVVTEIITKFINRDTKALKDFKTYLKENAPDIAVNPLAFNIAQVYSVKVTYLEVLGDTLRINPNFKELTLTSSVNRALTVPLSKILADGSNILNDSKSCLFQTEGTGMYILCNVKLKIIVALNIS